MCRKIWVLLVLVTALNFSWGAHADTIIGSPGDDGTILFIPSQPVFTVELFDAGMGNYPSAFGFYYQSDPSSLIAIFGTEDQDPDPNGANSIQQVAQIDFSSGHVYDVDDNNAIQSTFTPGLSPVGFFYGLDLSSIGGGAILLFTDPSLNGGIDAAATFPTGSGPYIIGFEYLNQPVSYEIISGVSPVPIPSTLLLLCSGLICHLVFRYSKK